MWRGISQGIHGYDAIDTNEAVTVRSEVARLTRLYDRAVKTNTINDPDYYGGAGIGSGDQNSGLRSRPDQAALAAPAFAPPAPAPSSAPAASAPPPAADVDESPATKAPAPSPPKQETPTPVKQENPAAVVPVENGTTDATPAQSSKTADPIAPTADPGRSDPQPPPTAAIPPPPAATTTITDPDASPATASKPPGKSNTPQSSKVTEDLSEA